MTDDVIRSRLIEQESIALELVNVTYSITNQLSNRICYYYFQDYKLNVCMMC